MPISRKVRSGERRPRRIAEAASGAKPIDYRSIVDQIPHDLIKPRLALEANAGAVGERDEAVLDAGIVGEAAEIAEHAGIGFRAAQPEAGGNRQRHLVAAVWEHAPARPAVALKHLERAGILPDAIGLRRIDLDDVVAFGLKAAEADEVFHVLR